MRESHGRNSIPDPEMSLLNIRFWARAPENSLLWSFDSHARFPANYRGISVNDDVGEEFSSLQDAEAHATIVANELGHHSSQAVTMSVFSEDGIFLAKRRHLSE